MSTWYRRAVRKVWPDLPVKLSDRELEAELVQPERRRTKYAKQSDLISLRRRMTLGLLVVAAVASLSAYLGYRANENGNDHDRAAQKRDTMRTCLSGGELRVLIAQSNDLLRRSAVGLVPGEDANPRVARFLVATQPAIDDLLTQAAGKPYHIEPLGGELTSATTDRVLSLSRARCDRRINGREPQSP